MFREPVPDQKRINHVMSVWGNRLHDNTAGGADTIFSSLAARTSCSPSESGKRCQGSFHLVCSAFGWTSGRQSSRSDYGVEPRNARLLKVPDVARHDREAVCQSGRGDHAVQHRERLTLFSQIRDQFCPAPADGRIPCQTIDVVNHCLKPSLKRRPLKPNTVELAATSKKIETCDRLVPTLLRGNPDPDAPRPP